MIKINLLYFKQFLNFLFTKADFFKTSQTSKLFLKIFSFLLFLLFFFPPKSFAQEVSLPPKEEKLEGIVTEIIEEKIIKPAGVDFTQTYQKLKIQITSGHFAGQTVVVETGTLPEARNLKYKLNDRVVLVRIQNLEGQDLFYISDFVRRQSLFLAFLLFLITVITIAHWQGIASLLGLVISFLVIFKIILPLIFSGKDPLLSSLLGSIIIVPSTFLLSHGFNKKTISAIIGTFTSLIIAGITASFFIASTRLTGFSSEEAGFLQSFKPNFYDFTSLLLSGIILSLLGVLDDITVSQAAIVQTLKQTSPHLSSKQVFYKAMAIGKDHIASMVNTLILVYTGVSLPLLLLFLDNSQKFSEIINYEIIAEEIVRTLVSSIALVLAVPLTTTIAILVIFKNRK